MAVTAAELLVIIRADLSQLTFGLNQASAQIRTFAGQANGAVTGAASQVASSFTNTASNFSRAVGTMTQATGQAATQAATAAAATSQSVVNNIGTVIGRIAITNRAAAAATTASLGSTQQAAIAAANAITTRFGGSLSSLRGVASALGPITIAFLALTAVVVGIGFALEKAAKTFAEYGFGIYKLAQVTGIAAQDLQVLSYAAEVTGSNMAGLQRGLIYLSKQMELAASGNKAAQARFHELGVETSDYKDKADALLPVLDKIAKKFEDTTNGYQKAAMASKLLSRFGGSDLIVMFNELGGNLRPFLEDLKRYGLLLDDEGIAKSKVLTQESIKLQLAWKGLEVQIGQGLYPQVYHLINALQDLIAWFDKSGERSQAFADNLQHLMDVWSNFQVEVHHMTKAELSDSGQDWISLDGVKYYEREAGYLEKMKLAVIDINQTQAELNTLRNNHGVGYDGSLMDPEMRENLIAQKEMQLKVDEEQIKAWGQVRAANQGGTGTLTDVNLAKAKNDGSDALRRSIEQLAKQQADENIKIFKDQMEQEKAVWQESYAERQVDAETYYAKIAQIAIATLNKEKQEIGNVIALLKEDEAAAVKKVTEAEATGDKAAINKAKTELNQIKSAIDSEQGRLADASRQTAAAIVQGYRDATKAALEFKKALEDEDEELLKLQGGTARFAAERLAADREYAEFTRKWQAELDARRTRDRRVEVRPRRVSEFGPDVSSGGLSHVESAAALAIVNLKKQIANLDEKAYLSQFAMNSAAQDEVFIREKISLGLISDEDAQLQINSLHKEQERALEDYIAQFQKLGGLNEEQVLQLKEAINQLNKLRELDMSPIQRFFKGLIDSTKTFKEEFGDAVEQMGKDLHSALSSSLQSLLKGDYKGFLLGLITGFRDALAKMVADMLASRLLKALANVLQNHFGIKLQIDSPQTVATSLNTTAIQANNVLLAPLNANLTVLGPQVTTLATAVIPDNTIAMGTLEEAVRELTVVMTSGGGGGGDSGDSGGGISGFFKGLLKHLGGGGGGGDGFSGDWGDSGFGGGGDIGVGARGATVGAGDMLWVGDQGTELAYAMPGGGMKIYNHGESTRKGVGGGTVIYETHYHTWNVQTPDGGSFAGRPTQLQIERNMAKSAQRGNRNN